jgi:hypothetical protein
VEQRLVSRRLAALLALSCTFAGVLIGAGLTWMLDAWPAPGIRPLAAGDERLNVLRSPDGLIKTVRADHAIDEVLHHFVADTPAIAYARVSIVHGGASCQGHACDMMPLQQMDLLHFSTIASVAAPGWPPMAMPQNHPLAEVRDYVVPVFAKPTCVVVKTADLQDSATAARIGSAGIGVVIDCSIFSPRNRFLGMFYANFHSLADLPADLSAIETRQRQAAAAVGRALVEIAP